MTNVIERHQVSLALLLVQDASGALVEAINEDGEPLDGASCRFSDGMHSVKQMLPLVPIGGSLQVYGGRFVTVGGRVEAMTHPKHRDSGANPLFQPRSRYDPTIQMEAAVKKLEKRANALVKREKALMAALEQRLNEVPNAQAQEPAQPVVVESQETGEAGSAAE